MRKEPSPKKTPLTRAELFKRGLDVQSLEEADALRKDFFAQRNNGVKAWADFVEGVAAANHALNYTIK